MSPKEFFVFLKSFFKQIPDSNWITGDRGDVTSKDAPHCSLGHLDAFFPSPEGFYDENPVTNKAIFLTTGRHDCELVKANNGDKYREIGHPKKRVLKFLDDKIQTL